MKETESGDSSPRLVLLFSGHMVDREDRDQPRFPPTSVAAASAKIAFSLAQLDAGAPDRAFSGGASGGDLLFADACLARGVPLTIVLPKPEEEFLAESVNFAGESWHQRYLRVKGAPGTTVETLPESYAAGGSLALHARTNRYLLERALLWGVEKLHFICLWDRKSGDGEGGTADMVAAVRTLTDRVRILDPAELATG